MPRLKKNKSEQPFSKVLKSIMKERNLRLADIAKMAGVSVSVAGEWTNGATPADMLKVKALANALDISFSFLLTGEHEMMSTNKIPTIAEVLTEGEKFEGIYKISVQRLLPTSPILKKGGSND